MANALEKDPYFIRGYRLGMRRAMREMLIAGIIAIVLGSLFGFLCAPAHATHPCGQFFYKHQAVAVVAPVYAAPVYYQAGRDIEADSLAEKVARLAVPKIIAQLQTSSVQKQQSHSQSAIAQHCAKCHSGAAPKAGIIYDGQTSLQCFQVTSALRAISTDSMPKDHKLTPEQKGAIMAELLDLEADRPQPFQVPPPAPNGELK